MPGAGGRADVSIRLGRIDRIPSEAVDRGYCRDGKERAHLFWPHVGSFSCVEGREILADPVPEVEDNLFRTFLTGPVLAVLLQQRGLFVMHASSVATREGVVAFMGNKGWGKSTMAAALHARGYDLVADDVTAVKVEDGEVNVLPAFPQIKLWPESAFALGMDAQEMDRIHPDFEKRLRKVSGDFAGGPLPLIRVYLLGVCGGDGEEIVLDDLPPHRALVELTRHTFGAEVMLGVGEKEHFLQCVRLVNRVPFKVLVRPWSLAGLSEVASRVEDDLL
ncbi:MAG: hypothetical protein K6T51_08250 [Rubrobacteraceae bacterium]|nr:hypothetical protein [Rubrobacteraceae bacterium]MCL6438590.1 hypothetical protein [Rubrobacteraceae bacterium]